MTKTKRRGLALAAALALVGAAAAAAPAQAWHGGPHGRPGWGAPPPHAMGGWRGQGPRHVYGARPYRAYAPRCVSRPRWVPGPWGMERVWVRRCW